MTLLYEHRYDKKYQDIIIENFSRDDYEMEEMMRNFFMNDIFEKEKKRRKKRRKLRRRRRKI